MSWEPVAADILPNVITLVEALNFRCLRYISRPMGPFHVLVGPNASGKTTFLDVVGFLGDLVSEGPEKAVFKRTSNFQDLTWRREGWSFELAIEAEIPEALQENFQSRSFSSVRYQVTLELDEKTQEIRLRDEAVLLKPHGRTSSRRSSWFSLDDTPPPPPESILDSLHEEGSRTVISKARSGNTNFYPESRAANGKRSSDQYKLGPHRSALGELPGDESKFPVSSWLKSLLTGGVHRFILNSLLIREASKPGQGLSFRPDGSNLPWAVFDLERRATDELQGWVDHLRTALPDLESVRTIERPDDKHRYLMLRYRGGIEVPSWMVSDGTLRLMALTLPAYLPDVSGIFLIEEPENGIHPRAIETMFQSLSSVYDAQVLLATHSPVILNLVEPKQLLCFMKTPEGATDIVLGSEHPMLKEWRREVSLSVLFASGVLGYGE